MGLSIPCPDTPKPVPVPAQPIFSSIWWPLLLSSMELLFDCLNLGKVQQLSKNKFFTACFYYYGLHLLTQLLQLLAGTIPSVGPVTVSPLDWTTTHVPPENLIVDLSSVDCCCCFVHCYCCFGASPSPILLQLLVSTYSLPSVCSSGWPVLSLNF